MTLQQVQNVNLGCECTKATTKMAHKLTCHLHLTTLQRVVFDTVGDVATLRCSLMCPCHFLRGILTPAFKTVANFLYLHSHNTNNTCTYVTGSFSHT